LTDKKQTIIDRNDFGSLLEALKKAGFQLTGPRIKSNAIVYDDIDSIADLPIGWIDEQDGGKYRLARDKNELLFGYVVGPQSWKKYLHPPRRMLYEVEKNGNKFIPSDPKTSGVKSRALIGVRSCELQAIAIQDKILLQGEHADTYYRAQREKLFILAVNCVRPGGTCFCTSMGTGPKATGGYDIALTEIKEGKKHYFLVDSGSPAGTKILKDIPTRQPEEAEIESGEKAIEKASRQMGRKVKTEDLAEICYRNFDHPHWEEITSRCLTCGNCTSVCPTCFCVNIEDTTSLDGATAQRWRRWDSCYNVDFSYIHGGSIRATETSRHRQWVMHKLAYWHDQFGTSGCVGCGRCITWCPVGIDITEEAGVLRGTK